MNRGQVRFGHRQTHAVTEALTERSRGRLDAWRRATLRMAGRDAAPFAKLFDLFERKIITGEVQQAVQQHRSVPRREHEAIAVEPFGIGRIVFEEPGPQHIRHRRGTHRHSRVPALSLLHSVHGEKAQSVNALIIQCRIGSHRRRRCVHADSSCLKTWRRTLILRASNWHAIPVEFVIFVITTIAGAEVHEIVHQPERPRSTDHLEA